MINEPVMNVITGQPNAQKNPLGIYFLFIRTIPRELA